ncbi:8644_t:CDS:10 [Acaulospora morrowiae]|uniref:SAGA-associated factor 11 n=1 Tax=Acaulospora morrowiae TaxID=94023 RepID=A0A9N8V8U9_9GLOM|nr:8644_t:CDS:10 [Acaulospora morrowiae]
MSASHDSQSVQSSSEVNDSLNNLDGSPDNFEEFSSNTQTVRPNEISSKAALAFSILCDLLDECTLDVIFEVHRETKLAASICQIYVALLPGLDIFGNHPQSNNSPTFECVHCQRPYPSKRYAPHLEKCMGLAGRSSSRVANLRMGNERNSSSPHTPYSEDNGNPSDSDGGLYIDKKRKKINGKSRASSPAKYSKSKKQKSMPDVSNLANAGTKLKLISKTSTGSESPAPLSTPDSPHRGQSPSKISFPTQSDELIQIDKSKNVNHFDQEKNFGINGTVAPMENNGDTSTQSTIDNDLIDVDEDETIEVLETSNNSNFLA